MDKRLAVLEKFDKQKKENGCDFWEKWSREEKKQLLELYLIMSKKEALIYYLIWNNHECDSWEDIFRDFSRKLLEDKAIGVEVAIETLDHKMKSGYNSGNDDV